jgi:hypothetical protein
MTRSPSECPFLSKAEAGQGYAIGRFCDLHLHYGSVGSGDLSGPQHRVLREYFAVYLGDKVILAGCVLAPDLPEFDALHGHWFCPWFSELSSQSTHAATNPSIAAELLLGDGLAACAPEILSGIVSYVSCYSSKRKFAIRIAWDELSLSGFELLDVLWLTDKL